MRNLAIYIILASLIGLGISFSHEVNIRVVDIFNQPVENANIIIENVVIRDPYTDCNGYLYAELPTGNYRITAKKGDATASVTVYINSKRDIVLRLDNNYFTVTVEPYGGSVLIFRNGCYKDFTSNRHILTGFRNANDKFEFVAVEKELIVFDKWEYENRMEYNTRLTISPNSNIVVRAYFKEIEIAIDEIIRELNNITKILEEIQSNTNQKLSEILNKLNYIINLYNRVDSRLSNIEGNISQIYLKLAEINSLLNVINQKLDKLSQDVSEIKSMISQLSSKIDSKLDELKNLIIQSKQEILNAINGISSELSNVLSKLNAIIANQEEQDEKLQEILTKLNYLITLYNSIDSRLSNIEGNISQIYLKLEIINTSINLILQKLDLLQANTAEIKNLLIDFSSRINFRLNQIESLIINSKNEIIQEINEIKNSMNDYFSLYLSIIDNYYIEKQEKAEYCIEILNEDYEKVFKDLIVLIRNCGAKNISNLNVLIKYNDKADLRKISLLNPNDIKYIRVPLEKTSSKININVYAFNENVSASKNIIVSFEKALVDIEVPKIKIKNKTEIEFYVRLINYNKNAVEDFLTVETPRSLYFDNIEKIKLGPFEEKYAKISLKLRELPKEDFEIKISFAGTEKLVKIEVEKEQALDINFLLIAAIIIIALIAIFLFRI